MQAFKECQNYEDYLSIIKEYMINDGKYHKEIEKGYSYLAGIKEKNTQDKIKVIFKLIDKELSYNGSKDNEMWKKINYLLSLGVFSYEYKEYFDNLKPNLIFILIYGEYVLSDYDRPYISLIANKNLLQSIEEDNKKRNDKFSIFGLADYFFMIKQHYYKNKTLLQQKEAQEKFINDMIKKINNGTLGDGVMNINDYLNSSESEEYLMSLYEEGVKNETRRF